MNELKKWLQEQIEVSRERILTRGEIGEYHAGHCKAYGNVIEKLEEYEHLSLNK